MKTHVRVRVTAGARNERVSRMEDGSFKMAVREPAENNAANARVIELLALHLGVRPQAIRMINGHHRASKLFEVANS